MGLLQLVVLLIVIGVLLFLMRKYIPMPPHWADGITILVVVVILFWLLSRIGLLPDLNSIRVGK